MAKLDWYKNNVKTYTLNINRQNDGDLIDFIEFCKENGVSASRLLRTSARSWQREHAFNTIEEIKYLCNEDI